MDFLSEDELALAPDVPEPAPRPVPAGNGMAVDYAQAEVGQTHGWTDEESEATK